MNWVQLFETWSMLSVANWTLLYFNGFGLGSAIELTQMFCQLNTIKHSKIKHFFNQTESNSRQIELCHWPALCHSKPVETVCCGQISYVWASILSTYTQPIWKRFHKWNLQFLNQFSKAITSALSPSVLEKILITLLEGKGGDWGSALKVFEENNRGQLGHLQCTMQTGVCALALDWLVQLSSEIELASSAGSVIELTEKFLFDYVWLLNQLANNWLSLQTQSSSIALILIDFSFRFIRLARPG